MRRAHQLRHVLSWKATESCSYHFPLHFKECIKYNLIIKKNIIVSRNWAANLPRAAAEWSKDHFLKSHFFPQRVCIEYTHKHRPWKGSAFPISTSSSSLLQGLLQNYLKSDGRSRQMAYITILPLPILPSWLSQFPFTHQIHHRPLKIPFISENCPQPGFTLYFWLSCHRSSPSR